MAADDVSTLILWTKLFMEEQGYHIEKNILYQDNKSAILLENNGKLSSSNRTKHMNIRYLYITDCIKRKESKVDAHFSIQNQSQRQEKIVRTSMSYFKYFWTTLHQRRAVTGNFYDLKFVLSQIRSKIENSL